MNKTFRKVLSVVLALVMVVTSMTVTNTTVKADGVIVFGTPTDNGNGTFTVAVTAEGAAYIEYYLQDADGGLHNAKSSNGWVWNTAPDYQPYMTADNVVGSDDGVIDVAAGGTFTLVCNAYSSKEVVDETTLLDTATIDIEVAAYVVTNTDLNLTVDDASKGNMTGDGPRFYWETVSGVASYQFQAVRADGSVAREWAKDALAVEHYYWGSDVTAEAVGAASYTAKLVAYDANGAVIAEDTIENVLAYSPVNTNAGLTATVTSTEAMLAWTAITNAASYEVLVDGASVATVAGTSYTMAIAGAGVAYAVEVKAYDADGAEIAITNNTMNVEYVAEGAPTEHDIANFADATWTKIGAGAEYEFYINSNHTLAPGPWGSVYVPHSSCAYHGERDKCMLGDAEAYVFQKTNVTNVWINGVKYGNPSIAFNNQGDCCELSMDVMNVGDNVVTLVSGDGSLYTFAIRVKGEEAPDTSNVDVSAWTAIPASGADSANVANTYYMNTASYTAYVNPAIWGVYAPASSTAYHGGDCYIDGAAIAFANKNDNSMTSVWVDGVKYMTGSEYVHTRGDSVEIAESLFAAEGVHYVAIVGANTTTFAIKTELPKAEVDPDQTLTEVTDWVKVDGGNDAAASSKSTYGTVFYISEAFRNAYIPYLDICGLYDDHASVNYHPAGCSVTGPAFAFALIGGYEGEVKLTAGTLKSVWIDGVKYTSGTELCYLDGDQIHLSQSLFEEVGTYAITVRTSIDDYTFALKVDNVPTYDITVDGTVVATVDEGATYTMGDATYGYTNGTDMFKAGTEITVTEDVELTSVNEFSVAAAQGAGIRYAGTAGIRFQARVSAPEAALNSAAVKTGMLITANDIYESFDSVLNFDVIGDPDGDGKDYAALNVVNNGWYNDQVGTYCGSIVDIVESNWIREFIAVAYATITYTDGTSVTVYSNMTGVRSIKGVAAAVQAAGYAGIATEYHATIDAFAAATE